ncbi:hypothetical protein QX51_02095 [Terrisporobacter othiniensis]|uniref:Uncharacterized protein n=1 Tax=Terrisporobacter othiniensis TaxID=1577792 RepID=A0A0B3W0L7_9FIRM|nr:hypothetical protein [Terrisporobacter othiniensis]KHS58568.1 hypothetical protein QX51_02095 [Terrisporobacter othiniensis]
MNQNSNELGVMLNYIGGVFDDRYLDEKEDDLNKAGIRLVKFDESGIPMNSFYDELISAIVLAINNEIVMQYINGILGSAIYDVLKSFIIDTWKNLKGKHYHKIYSGGKAEEKEASFGIQMKVNKNCEINLKLSGDISDSLKEKCVDDAFELVKYMNKSESKSEYSNIYAKYDVNKEKWVLIDIREEIEKLK